MTTDTVKIILRLPSDLHASLRQLSKQEHRSLNSQIVYLLAWALARQDGDEQPQQQGH